MKTGRRPRDPFIYPTRAEIEHFHRVIIQQRGEAGYVSKGMIDACVEFARTDTHTIVPFPSLISRASAMLYAFITFHPYADGNKRTSLITTSYFFFANGYSFDIPDDAPDFTKSVAVRCLDDVEHSTTEEIERIGKWLSPNVTQGLTMRLFYYLTRTRESGILGDIIWIVAFGLWTQSAFIKMHEFLK